MFYGVHINNFDIEAVNQDASLSWIHKIDVLLKVVGHLIKLSWIPVLFGKSVDHLQNLYSVFFVVKYKERHSIIFRFFHFNLIFKYTLTHTDVWLLTTRFCAWKTSGETILWSKPSQNAGEKSKFSIVLNKKARRIYLTDWNRHHRSENFCSVWLLKEV